jgi:hypothetical protein
MRKRLLTFVFVVVCFLISEETGEQAGLNGVLHRPTKVSKLRQKAKRKAVVWTKWRVGRVNIISIALDSLKVVPVQTERRVTQRQIRQWFKKQKTGSFLTSTPGPYFDTLMPERLVGWNRLPHCTSCRIHTKERVILVIPRTKKAGKLRFEPDWCKVQMLGSSVWAVEMGPSIWPEIKGEVSEDCTRTRETWRYALAFRGKKVPNELLILYDPEGSLESMAKVCRKLRVREAALVDGGSSIQFGSYYNLAFFANGRP